MKLSRREFLKKTGKVALAVGSGLTLDAILGGCATFDPNKDWSNVPPRKFDLGAFDKWFKSNKLYNKKNPNLETPHFTYHTFKGAIDESIRGWTPGISYTVPYGEVMVVSAPGTVVEIIELSTGRAGGKMVTVAHPSINSIYQTLYAHLSGVYVEKFQDVKRGDKIGNVTEHHEIAKLMVKDMTNFVDPDNYGENHSFMDYIENVNPVKLKDLSYEDMDRKKYTQLDIVRSLYEILEKGRGSRIYAKNHTKRGTGINKRATRWSTVEDFRYIECLYNSRPQLFPDLNQKQFEVMRNEFYDSQPFVLTLPFKKK